MLDIGSPAPEFTAISHAGKEVTLSTFTQGWLLFWWYPAANEPGTQDQGSAFAKSIADFESNNCKVVGISFDSVESNQLFHQNNDFPFQLLSDPKQIAGAAYNATRAQPNEYSKFARRISYLIDPQGYIVQKYEVTDPGGHAAAVLTDLEAAQR